MTKYANEIEVDAVLPADVEAPRAPVESIPKSGDGWVACRRGAAEPAATKSPATRSPGVTQSFTGTAYVGDPLKVAEIFRTPDLEAALYFAFIIFIILTDPPASPARYRDQAICGALVAAVSYGFFELTGVIYYLPAGVTMGNVWVAWRRFKARRIAASVRLLPALPLL